MKSIVHSLPVNTVFHRLASVILIVLPSAERADKMPLTGIKNSDSLGLHRCLT